ncbi:hypothetical protein GCM10023093_25890 [Nemorincola caseinilytica]|uniref:Secreted protein n=1 Tax=Nemorincola caseinilytica TaxID=2054315 RepID=A0ABP8NKD7_9BACT
MQLPAISCYLFALPLITCAKWKVALCGNSIFVSKKVKIRPYEYKDERTHAAEKEVRTKETECVLPGQGSMELRTCPAME